MIICGYPCIGKSTLAKTDLRFVDLESSNFKIPGDNTDAWAERYCKVAIDLHHQGYVVFVSTHDVVLKHLMESSV